MAEKGNVPHHKARLVILALDGGVFGAVDAGAHEIAGIKAAAHTRPHVRLFLLRGLRTEARAGHGQCDT